METNFIPLLVIVLIANTVEAISGFGSTIISLTLGSNFYDLPFLLPVMVPFNLLLSGYIVSRYHRHIKKDFLLKKILPFMGSGLLTGILIFNFVKTGSMLKIFYGIMVIFLSIRELNFLLRKNVIRKEIGEKWINFWVFAAGIVQGIYASGGPLLVYAISNIKFDKASFRSTLSTVWLTSNTILSLTYLQSGKLTTETLKYSLMLVPALIAGVFIGEKLHHHLNEKMFKTAVFFLLLIAGLALLRG